MNGLTFAGGVAVGNRDVVRFGDLRFWAERGLIHIQHARTGAYDSISVRAALERMKAIADMLGNRRSMNTEDQFDQANRKRHQDMLDGLVEICRKAQVQGMPSDASARRDLVRRRPRTVVVPGIGSSL